MNKILMGVMLAAVTACGTDEAPGGEMAPSSPANVVVSPVLHASAEHTYPARVVAGNQAVIATQIGGRVISIAELGARVVAGESLVRIEAAGLRAAVSQAEAALELAGATAARVMALFADGAASAQERDQVRGSLLQAEAALEAARAQLAYAQVSAPFSGTVTRRLVEAGALASPGQAILDLSGSGHELRLDLPAEARAVVQAGTRGRLNDGTAVEVLRVGTTLDMASRRFAVEMTAPATLVPGALVDVTFAGVSGELSGADADTDWLPADAIVRRGQLTGVFTIVSDTLRLRWVRLGRIRGATVELLAGPGRLEGVVREPSDVLLDGMTVGSVTELEFKFDVGAGR